MKKLLFLLLILFSCQKEEDKYCWNCEVTTVYKASGYQPVTEKSYIERCNMSDMDIKAYMEKESQNITIKIGNVTATTTNSYKCDKK